MQYQMLATWDGNNSLKRLARNEPVDNIDGTDIPAPGKSKEFTDTRAAGGDYYLTREEVDAWSKESIKAVSGEQVVLDNAGENPCEERWKNLSEEVTAKMWGVYEETGVFLALCRHSFVLLIADMVRSGELYVFTVCSTDDANFLLRSKYPLALLDRLLNVIGKDIAMGYDVGCGFGTTVARSPLGEKAKKLGFTSLVGAFHGHAHGRLCQLCHLATYKPEIGIEHLEQCEPWFSQSNELASSTRHMNTFHRRQAIARYCYHRDNFEAYSQLSKFLVDNYKQALEIQQTRHALAKTMNDMGIPSTETFLQWLKEERLYLSGLKKEPLEETLQMEYYKKLVKLDSSEYVLRLAGSFLTLTELP